LRRRRGKVNGIRKMGLDDQAGQADGPTAFKAGQLIIHMPVFSEVRKIKFRSSA